MSTFSVRLTPAAQKSLKKLEPKIQLKIQVALDLLSENPRPPASRRLSNSPYFRVRVGDHRILYAIENSVLVILIIDIGHRREVYRKN